MEVLLGYSETWNGQLRIMWGTCGNVHKCIILPQSSESSAAENHSSGGSGQTSDRVLFCQNNIYVVLKTGSVSGLFSPAKRGQKCCCAVLRVIHSYQFVRWDPFCLPQLFAIDNSEVVIMIWHAINYYFNTLPANLHTINIRKFQCFPI